ncbi:MAG: single-stranded-DNA-specific exonuclease RecJ [Lachnospiraceae bacterium]
MRKKWFVAAKRADFQETGKKFHITPMTARIIRNRDVIGDEQIRRYLSGGIEDFYDPLLMKGMKEGIGLIIRAIREQRRIRIIGDYDIDGVCATYILLRGFRRAGAEADTVIPDRMKDGYGINEQLIDRAYSDGISMIVTCDNGISASEQITHAKQLGMQVVVTDHHEVPFKIVGEKRQEVCPPADVIINPKQEDCRYPWKGLCGAAVAWKLVNALYRELNISEEELMPLLEFAAIATIGDIMELRDENRMIVKEGLKRIHHTQNLGLKSLIEVNGLEQEDVLSYHIGFVIGPCINAGGRLDTAKRALELFCTSEKKDADRLAGDLKALNDSRKALTQQGVDEAVSQAEAEIAAGDRVLVLYLPDCHESIEGIIAGRIRERYYRPTIVLTDAKDGIKGSGRSIPGYHMFEELSKCGELFTKFGGHPMAAGMSLPKENLEKLRRTLNHNCMLTDEEMTEHVTIDIVMPIQYVTEDFVEELKILEPFGNGNEKPVFAERNFRVISRRIMGKNRNVMKIYGENESGAQMEALYFGETEKLEEYLKTHERIHLTYYPTVNEFQGRKTLQIVIRDYQ